LNVTLRTLGVLAVILVCIANVRPLLAQDEAQLAALAQAGDFARARTLIAQLIDREPREPRHRYNLACAEARLGFRELALDSLETSVRLGFKDRDLLLTDEDLAALRDLPRFQAVAARVAAPEPPAAAPAAPGPTAPATANVQSNNAAPARAKVPAKNSAPAPAAQAVALPMPSRITPAGPEGLFFMTRFWMATGSLEQKLWYFTADGRVFDSPGGAFTTEQLERDSRRHGRFSLANKKLTAKWSDGKATESNFELDSSGQGFAWDGGLFSAVAKPDWSKVSGYFEGGVSYSHSSGRGSSISGLNLRGDGTFTLSRSASLRSENSTTIATAGSVAAPLEGKWKGEGFGLTLTFSDGRVERHVSFPTPDARDASKVGMLFFNGSMHLAKNR
jgi:hypothetical protein